MWQTIAKYNPIYKDRIPEWMAAGAMFLASIQLLWLTDTLEHAQGYAVFEYFGIPKVVPIAFLGAIGLLRLVSLAINGRWRRTPMIRAIGAIISAMFFTLLCLGGYTVAAIFLMADVYSGYRAGYDSRHITSK